ncbi:amino acid-binding protein [Halobellus sp. H-GB7]|uniref:amino acid-binding protein n=1 Tax=Halobellus sp. H-GB7 TaxID=3069756 RepID=UPI0027B775CB|nr:amino acid-binding protein [Halobellus sp. H-GB7]MDQ2055003.1 amino acid-binding protein [Halobellus sp. H-GB7]
MTSALNSESEADAESDDRTRSQSCGSRGDSDVDTGADGQPQPHTIRLELPDQPGQLLAALEPISDNGGNLLSIFHERGNVTPRGRIPVEVDVEATPDRFDAIVSALRDGGVNVVQAGAEHYAEEVVVLLVGHLVDTDLSDTLRRIEQCPAASIADFSLNAPEGRTDTSSARLRIATRAGATAEALEMVSDIAEEKELHVVEPLTGGAA